MMAANRDVLIISRPNYLQCIEEIAYDVVKIDKEQIIKLAMPPKKNSYGIYLLQRVNEIK